jgi:hypothetical protein
MGSGISMDYCQTILAQSNDVTAQNRMENGAEGVDRSEDKRKVMEDAIEKAEKEIEKLSKELEEASDQNCGESFGNWLTGSDGGVSDLQYEIQTKTAEMKKAQQEILVQQAKIETMLQELNGATSEHGQRTNDRQKNYDEFEDATQKT